jgi:hypothetical protein
MGSDLPILARVNFGKKFGQLKLLMLQKIFFEELVKMLYLLNRIC